MALTGVLPRLPPAPSRRILVVGGTNFVGPALVEAALAADHELTLFNRGISNPALFPYLERLRGFRSGRPEDQNLAALAGRSWDAVIDVWPSDPVVVESLASALGERVGHYLYISSVAAYDPRGLAEPGLTEDQPLRDPSDGIAGYNREKAESERRLQRIVGKKLTIVRPGAIAGYRDPGVGLRTWLLRARSGGRHIGPGTGEDHMQVVDVRDVARFLVAAVERSLLGVFNLTGESMPFARFLARCNEITRSNAEFVWIPEDFLRQRGLEPVTDFPYWRPGAYRRGFYQVSSQKAVGVGWTRRPLEEAALDCLQWFHEQEARVPGAAPRAPRWTDRVSPETEAQVLEDWLESKR